MKIVYLDRSNLASSIALRSLEPEHQWIDFPTSFDTQIIERSKSADVLAINKVPIGADVLEACPSVKHIAVSATGYNCVDIHACAKHGVSVSNIPSYASTTVSEHAISLTLALRRHLLDYRALVTAGLWQKSDNFCLFDKPIHDLHDSTFGVIGFGALGQATAKLANALGMRVIYYSRSPKESSFAKSVSLDELLRTSDIVSLHCSLNTTTRHLISHAELAKMQSHSILINTARGGVADENAVAEAIQTQQISGIGFDVLMQEPPTQGSPLLEIAHLNNVIITPHIAWASQNAMQSVADVLVDNIEGFINGLPQNLVT